VIGAADCGLALAATWPPLACRALGPVMLRRGAGGGKRVSAATVDGPFTLADLEAGELAMREMGQTPLYMIREGEDALDRALAGRGYRVVDPVLVLAGDAGVVASGGAPAMSSFVAWPALAIAVKIWAAGGIGAARVAVMERVAGVKTSILARQNDRAAGAAFVALWRDIAMLHALQVVPEQRRQGVAHNILRAAASWSLEQGAHVFSAVTTGGNLPAQAVFSSLGMKIVVKYHYRMWDDTAPTG